MMERRKGRRVGKERRRDDRKKGKKCVGKGKGKKTRERCTHP